MLADILESRKDGQSESCPEGLSVARQELGSLLCILDNLPCPSHEILVDELVRTYWEDKYERVSNHYLDHSLSFSPPS